MCYLHATFCCKAVARSQAFSAAGPVVSNGLQEEVALYAVFRKVSKQFQRAFGAG